MSRGLGVWQRKILAVLDARPAFYLRHLLPVQCTRVQQLALTRAAHRLEAVGLVTLTRFSEGIHPRGYLLVTRLGIDPCIMRRDDLLLDMDGPQYPLVLESEATWQEVLNVINPKLWIGHRA